jgi:prepilin-type N-terminal cleavage/methylation domain-containing protein
MLIRTMQSESGFSLVELMITLGLTAIIVLGASSGIMFKQTQALQLSLAQVRSDILFNIRQVAWDPKGLQLTFQNNQAVKNCLPTIISWIVPPSPLPTPPPLPAPPLCPSNWNFGISLYNSMGMQLSGPDADQYPGGLNPTASPLYYDGNGAVCTIGSGHCVFQVTTSFSTMGQTQWGGNQMVAPQDYPNTNYPGGGNFTPLTPQPYDPRNQSYPWTLNGFYPEIYFIYYTVHYCAGDPATPCGSNLLHVTFPDTKGHVAMMSLETLFTFISQ